MATIDDIIKLVGMSGCPTCLGPKFQDSWDAHKYQPTTTPRDRVIAVLGFFHWLHQSHVRAPQLKPAPAYRQILSEELADVAATLGKQVQKYGVFEVMTVFKSVFTAKRDLRGNNRVLRLDLVLEPRRKEHFDSCLAKLEGRLYFGELPKPLQESWKKLPIKSRMKPRSALDTYSTQVARESNLGRLPLYVDKKSQIYVSRAANGLLVLRLITQIPNDPMPWVAPSKRDTLIKAAFAHAFSKLKG